VSSADASEPGPAQPRPSRNLSRGTSAPVDQALARGDKAYEDGDLGAAKAAYAEARKLAPSDPAPRVGLVRVALDESDVPTNYAAAPNHRGIVALLKDLDAALALDREFAPAHVERGRLLLILGRADEALLALEHASKLLPGDPEAQSALGVALIATGHPDRALEYFRRASELDRDDPERLTNLGTTLMMLGRVEQAITAYERAVALAPHDPRAHGDLGTAHLAANRADRALPHLERAVTLAPERATYLSNLGYAHQLKGDLDRAIAIYKQAIAKDERLGSAWINLGTALAKQGKYAEAEQALKKALKLDPTDPRAKANLQELQEQRAQKPARAPAN
jgi:Flp pilus assembly protein TadD